MEISVRQARKSDIKKYTDLMQRTFQKTYTNERIGLTKDCFSREVFATKDTQKYLKSMLVVNRDQKTWLAFRGSKLVGSITASRKGKETEIKSFYVDPKYQGKGIGKQLWILAMDFAKYHIVLEIYAHNKRTIDMYRKWGFRIDKKKGAVHSHWPEWPEGLTAKRIFMISGKRK